VRFVNTKSPISVPAQTQERIHGLARSVFGNPPSNVGSADPNVGSADPMDNAFRDAMKLNTIYITFRASVMKCFGATEQNFDPDGLFAHSWFDMLKRQTDISTWLRNHLFALDPFCAVDSFFAAVDEAF